MPTEAKWEYETRGGLAGKGYPWGDSVDSNKAYYDGCVEEPRAVGIYAAKGYGLYGMAGNVYEWWADWYDENYYSNLPVKNPPGSGPDSSRVLRGGSWNYPTNDLRVATRLNSSPTYKYSYYGFRCASGLH